ncbi:MAG: hypothetical protein N2508_11100 [Anaerolineae bacterium]|nr:hypothetical protein [Anaerolineae bacterium]
MRRQVCYMMGCLILFVALFALAGLATTLPDSTWRLLLMWSPVFPAVGVGFFAARAVSLLDELQQRIYLEALAFSLANTVLVAVVLSLPLAHYAYNRPIWLSTETPIICVLPMAIFFWAIGLALARRRYR